ncbi:hypothetical protein GMMP1_60084 [Candidatus Magnetomoraceae bacterium gMMP-1]
MNPTDMRMKILNEINLMPDIILPQLYEIIYSFKVNELSVDLKEWKTLKRDKEENIFLKWLGRGKPQHKEAIDNTINMLRGRTDE